ncbi:MAG: hypothetical protein B7Y80_20135 [Hyphomicrobium sp. 32-62-53]|nr:MAG: hypothetical protein B7Z29_19965 [Hyphomicrobium sp. 12-62-95]OYX97343.1 MAG: hypothetical protein B7Y80_20135 [Hyphomicrobium sp. 32-62-53]
MAEEVDAAKARGEMATGSTGRGDKIVVVGNDFKKVTAAEIGIRRDEIHEARQLRDAEAADPGVVRVRIRSRAFRRMGDTEADRS